MKTIFAKTSNEIFHNTKVKEYKDGSYKVTCADRPVFKERGWEESSKQFVSKPKNMNNDTRSDSIVRAKSKFNDICRNNDFNMFFTFTFDPKRVDSLDVDEVKSTIKNFFSNLVQRNNAKYILVPEYHKSGRIHIHGLLSADVEVKYSGNVKVKGHKKSIKEETALRYKIPASEWIPVYNLPRWRYGHTTVMLFSTSIDKTNASKYITKYICKDIQKIFGNFYFAGGKGLQRDVPFFLYDMNYNEVEYQVEYKCDFTGVNFRLYDSSNVNPQIAIDNKIDEEGFFEIC